jgi:predicted ArsR family transcriptional regulator
LLQGYLLVNDARAHLLNKLGVSHNTLRLHLDAMAEKGEIEKEKRPSKGCGRPSYVYSGFGNRKAVYCSP